MVGNIAHGMPVRILPQTANSILTLPEPMVTRRTVVAIRSSHTAIVLLISGILMLRAAGADMAKGEKAKFTGVMSCASTSCHGGGSGHNEYIIYKSQDKHSLPYGYLASGTAERIAETLRIPDATKVAECTVCHAPLQSVKLDRLSPDAQNDATVSCETCHGAAENWLRFHTRPDVTFQQKVAQGMRNMNDIYARASTCVACHLNLDEPLRKAGHPELRFELDGQVEDEPPHYKDERPWLGPRQWLTGQAIALREFSWKLGGKPREGEKREEFAKEDKEALMPRWKALRWLLGKTEMGQKVLPQSDDFDAMQKAADQLARQAAGGEWNKQKVGALLHRLVTTDAEFSDDKQGNEELRRRAEVLVPAIQRLWNAYRKEAGPNPEKAKQFEDRLKQANFNAMKEKYFVGNDFKVDLEKLQELLPVEGNDVK
jgi:hypothetical protein